MPADRSTTNSGAAPMQSNQSAPSEAYGRRDEFFATLAHELRNPLSPLRNSLHILSMRGDDLKVREQVVRVMERQVNQMARLVDELLEVSRISIGKIRLHREALPLSQVIADAAEAVGPLMESQRHTLTVDIAAEPMSIVADPVKIAQAVTNLLNNAAKYTEPGGHILLRAYRDGEEAVISVLDDGTGIQENMLGPVFDLFTQVDQTLGRSQGGLGIGLALVKHFVQIHGGTVCARSDGPGKGSEFIVRLPLFHRVCPEVNAPEEVGELPPVTANRILVCDDDADTADTLAALLRADGNDVRIAYEGQSCIESADEFKPDIVLLDAGLPGITGFEVASRLRSRPWAKDAVFAAVTGWSREDDRRRVLDAGCDCYVVKPVKPNQLMRDVAELLNKKSGCELPATAPPVEAARHE